MNKKQLISFDYAIRYLLKDKSGYDIAELTGLRVQELEELL